MKGGRDILVRWPQTVANLLWSRVGFRVLVRKADRSYCGAPQYPGPWYNVSGTLDRVEGMGEFGDEEYTYVVRNPTTAIEFAIPHVRGFDVTDCGCLVIEIV